METLHDVLREIFSFSQQDPSLLSVITSVVLLALVAIVILLVSLILARVDRAKIRLVGIFSLFFAILGVGLLVFLIYSNKTNNDQVVTIPTAESHPDSSVVAELVQPPSRVSAEPKYVQVNVSGQVLDIQTHIPFPEVSIYFDKKKVGTSDARGTFQVSLPLLATVDRFVLVFEKASCGSVSKTVNRNSQTIVSNLAVGFACS